MEKIAYLYDPVTRIFSGSTAVQESPLEEGIYLWPPECTEAIPPTPVEGQEAVFDGQEWKLVPVAVAPVLELSLEEKRKAMQCSSLQAYTALLRADRLDAVEAQMANATREQKLAWNKAQNFYRLSPTLIAMWTALGGTDEELDDLFITAMGIQV